MAPNKYKGRCATKPSTTVGTKTKISKSMTTKKTVRQVKKSVSVLANGLVDLNKAPTHLVAMAAHNATTSALLRLPGEIRNTIWELAMGGNTIEREGWSKGGAFRAHGAVASRDEIMRKGYQRLLKEMERERRIPTAFHLPEVCRQIYSETATLAYKLNTFQIGCGDDAWVQNLLPAQSSAIRAVEPSAMLAEAYTTASLKKAKDFMGRSLRSRFPSLMRIVITNRAKDNIMFYNGGRMAKNLTSELWREFITISVQTAEGKDTEVFFQS